MEMTIKSRKLNKEVTFSRPGKSYIYADLNGQPGTLGNQICVGGDTMGSTISYEGDDQAAFEAVCRRWYVAFAKSLPKETYTIYFSNGHRETVDATCLTGAKHKATQMATFGAGGYSVETPDGEIHKREFWQAGNRFGWHAWERTY
jgi:hypothetical protein